MRLGEHVCRICQLLEAIMIHTATVPLPICHIHHVCVLQPQIKPPKTHPCGKPPETRHMGIRGWPFLPPCCVLRSAQSSPLCRAGAIFILFLCIVALVVSWWGFLQSYDGFYDALDSWSSFISTVVNWATRAYGNIQNFELALGNVSSDIGHSARGTALDSAGKGQVEGCKHGSAPDFELNPPS